MSFINRELTNIVEEELGDNRWVDELNVISELVSGNCLLCGDETTVVFENDVESISELNDDTFICNNCDIDQ